MSDWRMLCEMENRLVFTKDLNIDLVRQFRLALVKRALELSGGNKGKAARLLNIPRSSVYTILYQSLEEQTHDNDR